MTELTKTHPILRDAAKSLLLRMRKRCRVVQIQIYSEFQAAA